MDPTTMQNGSSRSSRHSLYSFYSEKMGETDVRYTPAPDKILGRGGSAIVYPGYHFGLNVETAVKYIEEQHLILDRYDSPIELTILQDLKHVNIIELLHSSRMSGKGMFLALQKAHTTFQNEVNKHSVQREDIIIWLKQVCTGVDYLHNKRKTAIIHRDIKPSNILIVVSDNAKVAKLSDFGLSKQFSIDNVNSGTLSGGKGTLPYMAPEILNSKGKKVVVKMSSDIYPLGMTMYYGISRGKHPFRAKSDLGMTARVLNKPGKPIKLNKMEFSAQDLLFRMMSHEANS